MSMLFHGCRLGDLASILHEGLRAPAYACRSHEGAERYAVWRAAQNADDGGEAAGAVIAFEAEEDAFVPDPELLRPRGHVAVPDGVGPDRILGVERVAITGWSRTRIEVAARLARRHLGDGSPGSLARRRSALDAMQEARALLGRAGATSTGARKATPTDRDRRERHAARAVL